MGNISAVSASSAASASQTSGTSKSSGSNLDMNDFFKLMSAELQYQDPTNPVSNDQYMSEMAQFSLLSQVETLSKSINLSVAADSIDKNAIYNIATKDGSTQAAGKIVAVDLSGDSPKYVIGGNMVSQSDIVGFYDPSVLPKDSTDSTGGSSSGTTGA